ncbi:MAG: nonstructural protein [Microviridae sp.]|nr:MAG: nonstructural protein [Microviridae sp.]
MLLYVVAVYDVAAKAYNRPFYVVSPGQAIRSFGDEVVRNAPENTMFHHPEDFLLFELGIFDDAVGKFKLLDSPKQLATGKQFKVVS